MSDVIETYIRRNSGMTEDAAFEGFLQEDRIKSWVGADDSRKERLRREFTRVWASLHPPATTSRPGQPLTRSAPQQQTAPVVVRPVVSVAPAAAPHPSASGARKLPVLCTTCGRLDVWLEEGIILCHACSTPFDNLLDLIPVKAVGVLEFYFGTGWKGMATAVGIVVGFVLLYVFLQVLS